MDVALDSNEFLSDPRMEGVRFQTLLSYLRKTQSDLLIPKIVLDEVIARYPERISEPHNRAANAVRLLRSLLLATKIPAIPELKVDREIAAMKRKLKKPSPHVQSVVLTNFGDVSVQEVARRGIERIPPANAKGEELRDVMIWLMVLRRAEKSGEDVAFISNDEHFREGVELHPKLKDDLQGGKIKLHFYKAIDDFIKAHAPAPRQLIEDEAYQLRSKQFLLDLFEIEARRFFPRYWGSATEVEITDRKLKFVQAALYDVGAGSQYGEIEVLGTLYATLLTPEYSPYMIANYKPEITFGQKAEILGAQFGKPVFADLTQSGWIGMAQPLEELPSIRFAEPITVKSVAFQVNEPAYSFVPNKKRGEATLSGKMAIAIRVVSNRVTKVELERLEITEVKAGTAAANPAGLPETG